MSNILITKAFCSTAVGSSKFVLIVLADAANSDSQTWQGLDTLAVKTGLSRSAIKNAMVRLVEDKHITMNRRYNKTNIYTIHPIECPKLKELLLEKPTLAARESLLDQIFAEISGKKKLLAEGGKKLMSQNLAHQNSESMSQNLAYDEPEPSPLMSQNLANNPKGTQNNPKEEADASPLTSFPSKAGNSKKKNITFSEYLQICQAEGRDALELEHSSIACAKKIGLSDQQIELEWLVFKEKYTTDEKAKTKTYIDWSGVFGNSVKGNWNKLYFVQPDKKVIVTSTGRAAAALHEVQL